MKRNQASLKFLEPDCKKVPFMIIRDRNEFHVVLWDYAPQLRYFATARTAAKSLPLALSPKVVSQNVKDTQLLLLMIFRCLLLANLISSNQIVERDLPNIRRARQQLSAARSQFPNKATHRVALIADRALQAFASDEDEDPSAKPADAVATAINFLANGVTEHFKSADARTYLYSAALDDMKAIDQQPDENEHSVSALMAEQPLWHSGRIFPELQQMWSEFSTFAKTNPQWLFWQRWYQSLLDGKPLDWDLQSAVARIPDDDWELGVEHIAGEISKKEAEHLIGRIPLAEKVVFSLETAKFRTEPIPLQNQTLVAATLGQVRDALDDALVSPANGLNERSREVLVLRRTLDRYDNDPQRIEIDFTAVHSGLTRQIAVDDLPPSEENLALQMALQEGARAIRATHPEIAANRELISHQAVLELSSEQKTVLLDAQPVLVDISEGTLQADFAEDIPLLLKPSDRVQSVPELGIPSRNPIHALYAEKLRTTNRAASLLILLKRYPEYIKKVEENSIYRSARILGVLAAVVALGIALF